MTFTSLEMLLLLTVLALLLYESGICPSTMSSEMFVFPLLRLFFFYILQLDNDVLSWGFCFGFVELPVYED